MRITRTTYVSPDNSLARRVGVTLIEVLVALAITGIFLAGVMEAFVYILQSSERSEANLEAITNARAALEQMAVDIKAARIDPRRPIQFFYGQNFDFTYGDAVDNDQDGRIDQELRNGRDDDADYGGGGDDLHVSLGTNLLERKELVNLPDLGDRNIDEDCLFSNDILEILTFPGPDNPGYREKKILFRIDTFDNQPNVLVRRVQSPRSGYTVRGGGSHRFQRPFYQLPLLGSQSYPNELGDILGFPLRSHVPRSPD